jgi:hypothetical protein
VKAVVDDEEDVSTVVDVSAVVVKTAVEIDDV